MRNAHELRTDHASPSAPPPCCTVDALEQLVHFTGAGADACFYANATAQPTSPKDLRYWLNPSVRARPTTATCEITNLGPPFFAATSTAVLRVAASPLFANGRCFPTKCVLSLATSAQRLDGVSLRPVVIKEWSLNYQAPSDAVPAAGASLGVLTPAPRQGWTSTELPLRTLYHLALLMGAAPCGGVEDVRLYVQLRFTGGTDASDTHRIAAIRLQYERLGDARDVLPLLQQRRRQQRQQQQHGSAAPAIYDTTPLSPREYSVKEESVVEEVEVVNVTCNSSSASSSPDVTVMKNDIARRGHTPLRVIGVDSPPQRSATKPRVDKERLPYAASVDRNSGSGQPMRQLQVSRQQSFTGDDERSTDMVRVERVLRMPPHPLPAAALAVVAAVPPSCTAPALHTLQPSPSHDALPPSSAEAAAGLSTAWRQPRMLRTIVLAPSISPSLTSASRSSSPNSPAPSNPPPSATRRMRKTLSPAEVSSKPPHGTQPRRNGAEKQAVQTTEGDTSVRSGTPTRILYVPTRDGSSSGGGASSSSASSPASTTSSASPPPRLLDAASALGAHHSAPTGLNVAEKKKEGRFCVSGVAASEEPWQRSASNPAVLWAASSLLGTAPWTLHSALGSRAASARSSRASSRERSATAPSDSVSAGGVGVPLSTAASQTSFNAAPLERARHSKATSTTEELGEKEQRQSPRLPSQEESAYPKASSFSLFSFTDAFHLPGWKASKEQPFSTTATPQTAIPSFTSQWRSSFLDNKDKSDVNGGHTRPQLQPPRSTAGSTPSGSFSSWLYAAQNTATTAKNEKDAAPSLLQATQPPSAYVPRLQLRTASSRASFAAAASHQDATAAAFPSLNRAWKSTTPALPPPPSQNRDLWSSSFTADTSTPATVEEGAAALSSRVFGRCGRRQPENISANAPGQSTSTARNALDAAPVRKNPISVIPASWLDKRAAASTQSRLRPASDVNALKTGKQGISLALSQAKRNARKCSTRSSASTVKPGAEVAKHAEAPPPPSAPPPRSRVLFHSGGSLASSAESSRSSSSVASEDEAAAVAAVDASALSSAPSSASSAGSAKYRHHRRTATAAPALPLQEERHPHVSSRSLHRKGSNKEKAAARFRASPPRSRSAPPSSSARRSSPFSGSVPLEEKQSPDLSSVQTFAVWKHHASRNGVGRRQLTIRPMPPSSASSSFQPSDDVRCFIALEKVGGAAQLRATLSLGRKGNGRSDRGAVCEVPVMRHDLLEVWTGVQAFQSGVMHQGKVRRTQCCLVLRCNRQLMAAVEMQTAHEVETVRQLLLS